MTLEAGFLSSALTLTLFHPGASLVNRPCALSRDDSYLSFYLSMPSGQTGLLSWPFPCCCEPHSFFLSAWCPCSHALMTFQARAPQPCGPVATTTSLFPGHPSSVLWPHYRIPMPLETITHIKLSSPEHTGFFLAQDHQVLNLEGDFKSLCLILLFYFFSFPVRQGFSA